MPDGFTDEEKEWHKKFWEWVAQTYGAEYVTALKQSDYEEKYREVWGWYYENVVTPEIQRAESEAEAKKAARRKRGLKEVERGAAYLAPYRRIGMTPLQQWRFGMVQSFPEGFGGYAVGTVGFFKALGEPRELVEQERIEEERIEEERQELEAEAQKYWGMPWDIRAGTEAAQRYAVARAWETQRPQPEYGRAFTEAEAGLMGATPWKDWFSSQYPSVVAKFKTTIPEFEARYWTGMTPKEVEIRAEKTWAEYLKAETPRLKEEYATRYPFGQYGRPWAYQPRIQTVAFR